MLIFIRLHAALGMEDVGKVCANWPRHRQQKSKLVSNLWPQHAELGTPCANWLVHTVKFSAVVSTIIFVTNPTWHKSKLCDVLISL